MAAAEIKTIFTVDTSGLISGIAKASEKVKGLSGAFDKLHAAGTLLAARSMWAFASQSLKAADDTADMADSLGMTIGALQAFRAAAVSSGVPLEKMDGVISRIASARFDAIADGTSKAAESFKRLGIDTASLRAGGLEGAVNLIGRAMRNGANDADVMSAALDIIGSKSVGVVSALKQIGAQGNYALQSFRKSALNAAVPIEQVDEVLSRIAAARLDAITDSTSKSSESFRKLGIDAATLKTGGLEGAVSLIGQAMRNGASDADVMAAALDIIGEKSLGVVTALKQIGSQGIEPLQREMEQARAVPFEETTKELAKAGEALERFGMFWKSAGANVLAAGTKFTIGQFGVERFDIENQKLQDVAEQARSRRLGITKPQAMGLQAEAMASAESLRTSILGKTDALTRIGGGQGVTMDPAISLMQQELSELRRIREAVTAPEPPVGSGMSSPELLKW